jgi:homoserine kinase
MAIASAPASAANLGPGFDVLALALELRCQVKADASDRWSVRHTGPEYPAGHFDIVLDAAQRAVGDNRPLDLIVDNHIPIGKGLGSSAAAATAGAVAAWRAVGEEPSPERAFKLVAEIEDHPDNAAAAVYGGLVLCPPDGEVRRLQLHSSLLPLVAIPNDALPTTQARELLGAEVARDVAVRSLGRMGSLVLGLVSGDETLLLGAAGDEMHEMPRNGIRPRVKETIEAARSAGAAHVCWSGAGPGVLALVKATTEIAVTEALRAAMPGSDVRRMSVATEGYR